jgi:hypothetical protein
LLLAALVLLLGAVLWGLKVARATRTTFNESAGWPVVTGTIIESRIVDRGGLERYCPFVRYAYDLGGSVFHASRIALLPGDPSLCSRAREAAAHVVQTYPVERQVAVHYDPVEPGRSVLEVRELPWLQAFPQTALILIFVLTVVVLRQAAILIWRRR